MLLAGCYSEPPPPPFIQVCATVRSYTAYQQVRYLYSYDLHRIKFTTITIHSLSHEPAPISVSY